jgi:hypothetical protein
MSWYLRFAVMLPLLSTATVLGAVQYNRSGGRDPIVLTERELPLQRRSADDTAATLSLMWQQPHRGEEHWLTREKLRALGFRVDVDPNSPGASDYYRGPLRRQAYVVSELNGPAWDSWIQHQERPADLERREGVAPMRDVPRLRETASRLVAVDADRDANVLHAKYPNARTHLVTAAVIRMFLDKRSTGFALTGFIDEIIPRELHVPADIARALPPFGSDRPGRSPGYIVTLRYGRRHEPWIVDISR